MDKVKELIASADLAKAGELAGNFTSNFIGINVATGVVAVASLIQWIAAEAKIPAEEMQIVLFGVGEHISCGFERKESKH